MVYLGVFLVPVFTQINAGAHRPMKRHFLPLLALVLLILIPSKAQTVYVTKNDQNYHVSDCRLLGHSKTAMELCTAKAGGYNACRACHPAQDITTNTLKQEQVDEKVDPETGTFPALELKPASGNDASAEKNANKRGKQTVRK